MSKLQKDSGYAHDIVSDEITYRYSVACIYL